MKFPGIDLSPGALILRRKADRLAEHVEMYDVAKAEAIKLGVPAEAIDQFSQQVELARQRVQRIEREITS
jgi:hypothetical protein